MLQGRQPLATIKRRLAGRRAGTSDGFPTESDLEPAFAQAFRATTGIHFVWTSSQNIDRLA